ncbi:hypothetical protein Acy02nite_88830 [Actinoplanes cyaneus]|uniref:Uncharacterized protein n=1 Tax=Actinoplanes cyaneus TaxID=52696 RepID=A0A919M9M1_9ACTN|nr:SCO2522 family protein [Actinoplanes cyaneus]MCW2144228.1 hypothetical protein [Actinoplanes cyaneus]GID71002.1 hypothetical protein Acy02nite_88830 [Actinoplanes cyaneus]
MTETEWIFEEQAAVPRVHSVPYSHRSIELGYFPLEELLSPDPASITRQFATRAPWVAAARQVEESREGIRPRISTCVLVDDFSATATHTPSEVFTTLLEAAGSAGLEIDYVARLAAFAQFGDISPAELVSQRIVEEPPAGTTAARPPVSAVGWLTNGERSPSSSVAAMSAPRTWQPPREHAVRSHSVFLDVELWTDGPDGRLWSASMLYATWQLFRLGLLRSHGRDVFVPSSLDSLPGEWAKMPPIIRLNPAAPAFCAYRTLSFMNTTSPVRPEAVRTILSQVAVDWTLIVQSNERAAAERLPLSSEIIGRTDYVIAD